MNSNPTQTVDDVIISGNNDVIVPTNTNGIIPANNSILRGWERAAVDAGFEPFALAPDQPPTTSLRIGRTLGTGRRFVVTDPNESVVDIINALRFGQTPIERYAMLHEILPDGSIAPGGPIRAWFQHHNSQTPIMPEFADGADLIFACHPNPLPPHLQQRAVFRR